MKRKILKSCVLTVLAVLLLASPLCVFAGGDKEEADSNKKDLAEVTMILAWVVQGEFAGFLVAKELGYYEDEGIDLTIVPGGADIQPVKLVATGNAEFAIGNVGTVILSRAQGIPVSMVYQQNEIDGLRFVAKKKSGINEWKDLEGKKVGVWFGGGEWVPQYAMKKIGVPVDSVEWLPQKYSMIEFFEDKFDAASVQIWNELHVVLDAGYSRDDLTILNAADLGIFLPADGIYTLEKTMKENPEIVQGIVNATARGFQYTLAHPEESAEITLKYAPDLDLRKQLLQVEEVNKLIMAGGAEEVGALGYMRGSDYVSYQEMLIGGDQLKKPIDIEKAYNLTFWNNIPDEYKNITNREEVLKRANETLR